MAKRDKVPGVFIHRHIQSGAYYIGVSADLFRGVVEDQRRLRKGEHFSHKLQELYDKNNGLDSETIPCQSYEAARDLRRQMVADSFSDPNLLNKSSGMNVCAVYRLTHKPSGRFYIGSTSNFTRRRQHHEYFLLKGSHNYQELQELFNQDPNVDHLQWDVILAAGREFAYSLEQTMLDKAQGDPLLLNKTLGVFGCSGMVMSDEFKEKVGLRSKEMWKDEAFRQAVVDGKKKKVLIGGVEYASVIDASKETGIYSRTLYARVKAKNWPDYRYV